MSVAFGNKSSSRSSDPENQALQITSLSLTRSTSTQLPAGLASGGPRVTHLITITVPAKTSPSPTTLPATPS
ncbi:hypothetical protein E2C01_008006 [Portunus trituberculatus]|uniref:Uncharacterized protein n=1 Tax=Portunus trituberculatus TaxID=210409 RepID=A0A5B7D1Y2_PORTR|nr:hypothetical protein [Portunus trituberculatus]